jgi:hypothetical protein
VDYVKYIVDKLYTEYNIAILCTKYVQIFFNNEKLLCVVIEIEVLLFIAYFIGVWVGLVAKKSESWRHGLEITGNLEACQDDFTMQKSLNILLPIYV